MTEPVAPAGHRTRNLGPLAQIPMGEGREFDVGGQRVAVFHARDGRLYATQAACPHLAGRLADGLLGGAQIICPQHGYRFDLSSGQALGNDCAALRTYAVQRTDEGEVQVHINP